MCSLSIDQQCYLFGRHSLKAVLGCLPVHINSLPQPQLLTTSKEKAFENIVGKGENADNQYFHLFPRCLLPNQGEILSFQQHLFFTLSVWTCL